MFTLTQEAEANIDRQTDIMDKSLTTFINHVEEQTTCKVTITKYKDFQFMHVIKNFKSEPALYNNLETTWTDNFK